MIIANCELDEVLPTIAYLTGKTLCQHKSEH
jgi:hypothetical protein